MSEPAPSPAISGPLVDAEHPWLGLHPFTEENQHYFFGRSAEIRDIFLRVREQPLTVLYGQSGLGKTSLLRAGLIPKLRVEHYRPERILLDFDPKAPPLITQVREAVARACAGEGGSAAALIARWESLRSLWEIFTHEELRPGDLAEHPPVLIFDQFEEVFTLGNDGPGPNIAEHRRNEITELIAQLGDVVEGRAPAALAPAFNRDARRALAYDFGPTPVRVVLSLREDYLAHLEGWKGVIPSLMRNRMALRLLSGPQALEAVVRPGSMGPQPIVSSEVGMHIVRFVAQRTEATPLEEIEAVPPFVSLLCEQLNAARLEARPALPEITRDLVDAQGADILQRFYDESFAPFPPAVREYVEDRMVTIGGHRNPVAREDAREELKSAGVADPDAALDALVARRLLSAEQRGGTQRIEITHDVLAPLVMRSRKGRQERRALALSERQRGELRRARRIALALAVLGLVALGMLGVAIFALRSAKVAQSEATRQFQSAALAQFEAEKQRTRAEEALGRAQASEQQAKSEKERAIAAKKSADQLISYMQYDLSDTLRRLGQLKMMEGVNTRIRKYHQEHPPQTSDTDALREESVSLSQQGDILREQGKLDEALKAYRGALAITERLAKEDPGNTTWQHDLAVRYDKLGNILREQGQLVDALKAYRDSNGISERLAEQDSANREWQNDLALGQIKVGDVLVDQGERADALKAYREALAIAERLATGQPDNADWQRTLSLCHDRIGDILRGEGQFVDALKAYQDSRTIREQLAKTDPGNVGWQRDLVVSGNKVGDALRAQGQLADALKAYRDSLVIIEQLAKQDPANARWQRDLFYSLFVIARTLEKQDKLAEALTYYERAEGIAGTLTKLDPTNVTWKDDAEKGCTAVKRVRALLEKK